MNAVIIQTSLFPKHDFVRVLMSHSQVITYIAGDPLQKSTMARGCANRAKACILMTNKNSPNSSEQDFKNILIALAVKREVFVDN